MSNKVIDILSGKAKEIVMELASLVQVSEEHAFNEVMATASLCVGGMFKVYNPLIRKYINCNNFYITVAESSERKSSVQNAILDGYNRMYQERNMGMEYHNKLSEYEYKVKDWEKGYAKSIKDNGGVPDIGRFLSEKPLEPIDPNIFMDDITQEGLFHKISEGRLPVAGIWSAEGGVFFRGVGMSCEGISRIFFTLNKLWSNERISSTRKYSRGTIGVPETAVSLNLAMQENVFYNYVATEDSEEIGFTARLLVCKPKTMAGSRTLDKTDRHYEKYAGGNTELEIFRDKVGSNLINIFNKFEAERSLVWRKVELESDAEELLREKYNIIEKKQAAGGEYGSFRAFAGKMVQHMLRVAVNIMWIENVTRNKLSKEHIESAYRIICWYMNNHIAIMSPRDVGMERTERRVESAIRYIRKQEAERNLYFISYKELRAYTSLNNCRTKAEREEIVNELINREVLIDRRNSDKPVISEGNTLFKYFEIVKTDEGAPTIKADPNDSYVINEF